MRQYPVLPSPLPFPARPMGKGRGARGGEEEGLLGPNLYPSYHKSRPVSMGCFPTFWRKSTPSCQENNPTNSRISTGIGPVIRPVRPKR